MYSTHDEIELDVIVVAKEPVARGVMSLTLARVDGEDLPGWAPGSHIDLHAGNGITRQYSLCGDPSDLSTWRIAVLREEDSRGGSVFVHDSIHAGDTVRVTGPRNHFRLEAAPQLLFVAGGIGITPIFSMLGTAAEMCDDWTLVYGGRTRKSMAFVEELRARYGDRVRILPQDEHGLLPLAELVSGLASDAKVYCCGPEPLISAMEDETRGLPAGTLHLERFSPREDVDDDNDVDFEIELGSSSDVIHVPAGTTALKALLDAGVDVPYSCTEGVCGTCETEVLGGTPLHRDSVLTEEERESNETMFPCVSRALTQRVTLDL